MDVRDAAVSDPCLGAVEHPFIGGLVVDSAGAITTDIGTGVGLRGCERSKLEIADRAVTLRHPFHDLLAGARSGETRGGKT